MSNKKDRAFTVRFTEEQFQHIKEQSERAMMSPSNYIRATAMRGRVNVILDGKSVARELKAIGNNLNQLLFWRTWAKSMLCTWSKCMMI